AWIARLQAAGTRGLHPGIRAGGPATPTSNAARAGAATIIALTIKLDPSVGADQLIARNASSVSGCGSDAYVWAASVRAVEWVDHSFTPASGLSLRGRISGGVRPLHLHDGRVPLVGEFPMRLGCLARAAWMACRL